MIKSSARLPFTVSLAVLILCSSLLKTGFGSTKDETPSGFPDTTATISYKTQIQRIWNRYSCATCHAPASSLPYPDLRPGHSYESIYKYGYINLEEPEKSSLVTPWLTDGLMPPDYQRLKDEEIERIVEWIRQGALDN